MVKKTKQLVILSTVILLLYKWAHDITLYHSVSTVSHYCWWLFSPQLKLASSGEAFSSVPALFLSVLQPKYMTSSTVWFYHLVLLGNQEYGHSQYCLEGSMRLPWHTTHWELYQAWHWIFHLITDGFWEHHYLFWCF